MRLNNINEEIDYEKELMKDISIFGNLKMQSENLCLKAIEISPSVLQYIKPKYQTEKVVIAALKKDGLTLEYVADKKKKYCLEAVRQNGKALQFVPAEEQTPFMCREAILKSREYGTSVLQYIKKQTTKLCLLAIKKNPYALGYVRNQTPQICMEAVKFNSWALEDVENQTHKLCMIAVMIDGYALQFVKKKTLEICFASVKQNGGALRFVPVELQTENMCILAMKGDSGNLEFVQNQTDNICKAALETSGCALKLVKNKTYENCLLAIRNSICPCVIFHIPSWLQTDELIREALNQNGEAIQNIDNKRRKDWMYEIALQKEGTCLKYIEKKKRTYQFCKMAVSQNGMALKYVPEKFKTEELCNIALAKNGFALKYIKNRTIEYCFIAVKQNARVSTSLCKSKFKLSYYNDSNGPEDEDICVICQEFEGSWCKLLSCSHQFHVDCINDWFEKKNICPMCNQNSVPEISLITI